MSRQKTKKAILQNLRSVAWLWALVVSAIVVFGVTGCGVDTMTAAATVATLQAQQAKAAKAQESQVIDAFKAAQDTEAKRVANSTNSSE